MQVETSRQRVMAALLARRRKPETGLDTPRDTMLGPLASLADQIGSVGGPRRTPGIFREGNRAFGVEQMGLPPAQRRPLTLTELADRQAKLDLEALEQPKPQQQKKRPDGVLTGVLPRRPFSGKYPTNRRSFTAEF